MDLTFQVPMQYCFLQHQTLLLSPVTFTTGHCFCFGPISSWQIDGETMKAVIDFIFLGSKITADGDCSHDIKRRLPLGRKAMSNLDNILKSRDITLPTKVHVVKTMVFPVAMYECESWTIKKANLLI